jgi:hypothetical protein
MPPFQVAPKQHVKRLVRTQKRVSETPRTLVCSLRSQRELGLRPLRVMVGQVGIEPTTVGLKGRRSAPELLTHATLIFVATIVKPFLV